MNDEEREPCDVCEGTGTDFCLGGPFDCGECGGTGAKRDTIPCPPPSPELQAELDRGYLDLGRRAAQFLNRDR